MALKGPVPLSAEHKWDSIPEILYEAPRYPGAKTDPIPYIEVPKGKKMPPVLFIMEYTHTGEMEVGSTGQPEEVMEQLPHKFVDFEFLISRLEGHLSKDTITQIYYALGMLSRRDAKKLGEEALERVFNKSDSIIEASKEEQESRIDKVKLLLENMKNAMKPEGKE
jgi:hypothetical protein